MAGRRRPPTLANQDRRSAENAAAPLPRGGTPVAFREKTSERGGRSSGRLSGALRRPPPSELHQRRPLLVPPPPSPDPSPSRPGHEPHGCLPIQGRSDRQH